MYPTFFKQDIPTKEKIQKPIPKISEKKKKRLKEEGSEMDLFKKIALERSTDGYVQARDIEGFKSIHINDLQPINFSHVLGKGMNKSERLNPANISIVTFAFHFTEHTGLRYMGPYIKN